MAGPFQLNPLAGPMPGAPASYQSTPAARPLPPGADPASMYRPATDIRQGIIETANALGMDPGVLATIISYETAGTFDPTKRGPTTKWGQHRGLIQFGEPQAKQYGVDWNDPLGSQLGPDGAIVKYFRSSGWKPGMSELDAYSVVNAGAPGRYNASDTAAGGAPGTVKDKVETQFGPHRDKAYALLGGAYTPSTPSGGYASSGGQNALAGPTGAPQNALAQMQQPQMQWTDIRLDPEMFMNKRRGRNALAMG